MGEERRSSPSVCLHDFFAQKFDGVLFNARYIAPRLLQTMPGITRALISGNIIGTPAFRARSGNQPRGQEQLPSRSKGQGGAGAGAGRVCRAQPYPQPQRTAGQRGVRHLRTSHARIQKRAEACAGETCIGKSNAGETCTGRSHAIKETRIQYESRKNETNSIHPSHPSKKA